MALHDLLLRDARVFDGSGAPPRHADASTGARCGRVLRRSAETRPGPAA